MANMLTVARALAAAALFGMATPADAFCGGSQRCGIPPNVSGHVHGRPTDRPGEPAAAHWLRIGCALAAHWRRRGAVGARSICSVCVGGGRGGVRHSKTRAPGSCKALSAATKFQFSPPHSKRPRARLGCAAPHAACASCAHAGHGRAVLRRKGCDVPEQGEAPLRPAADDVPGLVR